MKMFPGIIKRWRGVHTSIIQYHIFVGQSISRSVVDVSMQLPRVDGSSVKSGRHIFNKNNIQNYPSRDYNIQLLRVSHHQPYPRVCRTGFVFIFIYFFIFDELTRSFFLLKTLGTLLTFRNNNNHHRVNDPTESYIVQCIIL